MSDYPPEDRGRGLPVSGDPAAWSPEYRELSGRIRSVYRGALVRGGRVPPILEIHPGPACPAGCRFCPTRGAKLYPPERRREPLSAEELRILVKDFAALGGETLILSGGLEPLGGPAIPTATSAAEAGLEVHLYTSGLSAVLDDPEERRALLASVRRVRFSVNGMSEATYGDVQLAGRAPTRLLARVSDRLAVLVRDRSRLGASTAIGLSFLATSANVAELESALELCDRLELDFFHALVDIIGDVAVAPEVARSLEALRRRAADRRGKGPAVRVSGRTGTAPARTGHCIASRVKVAIDPFGMAWRCCYVANPEVASAELLLGDVRKNGLRAVLHAAATPVATGCATCPDFERTVNALADT